ncbi:HMA2 domain-containing protein [Christensenella hongkongensis]|jgi:hypothetical protein|nr:hypothetical protein [Christensenella hongkongensis]
MRELAPAYFIAGQGDIMSGGFLAAALLPILGNMILNGGKNKRKPNQLNLPSFRGVLEVKSAVDGRIRFSIPFLKGNGQMAAQAEQQISRLKPVSQVSINTVTGSLLVCYDSCAVQPQLLQAAVMKLLGLEEAANESGGSLLGRECRTFAQSMNHAVADKTGGLMDLNFLISILMMGVGMFFVLKNPAKFPNGYTLLRWGTNQLLGQRGAGE